MTDLDHIRADILVLHAYAERMKQVARHAIEPRADHLWMVAYGADSERAWRHVVERCYGLEAQIERQSAQQAQSQDGERVP